MRRREFIAGLSVTAAMPLLARAQQPERMRRIGVLFSTAADDPESSARTASFLQGLRKLGWIEGRNLRIDIRWAAGMAAPTSALRGTAQRTLRHVCISV
jgi:putative tryptophan/tyrosine transport system substrate-binding protein